MWVSPECIAKAKEMDLLTYLERYEPNNLVRINANTYSTKEHDSLKISNGIWHWFSRHIGGRSALDYLIKVKEIPFTEAVSMLSEDMKAVPYNPPKPVQAEQKELEMPKLEDDISFVRRYLRVRGIHPQVIDFCRQNGILFEDSKYHNCVFIGKDESGNPKFGCVRSTITDFKMDLPGSDKRYSFCIPAKEPSARLRVFEAAIDLLSFASLAERYQYDWRADHLLSLSGVYLSEKDEDYKIENQRKLLQDFVENNDELSGEIAEYVDDGFTGTNFDRPGFLRMIEDAKKGKIGTIIVKDLSRLGRDYIGVGDYLEQIFPSMGIRVIAINSNYDSENFVGNTLGMDVSITNLVNSLYSKDLSKKVRSGKIAKWKNGGTTGERQPFGYVRDPMQQKTWNIDPEAAKIVKLIFDKANEGWGTHQITDLLNELELPTPSKFYQQKYGVKFIHVKVDDKENIWDTTKVWRILRCYSYTGNVIHGKRSRIIVGNSTARKVAEKDRILVKNVLPPIITEEEFDKAQFVIKKQGTDKKGNDLGYPLTFRVKCGNCKLSMSYKTKNGLCLTCRHATVSGDKTTCQKVDYPADVIENQVYHTIKKQMSLLFELGEKIAEKSEETKIQSTEKVKTVDARIKELQEEKVRQYESYANGNLKRDLFVEAKMKIDEELNSLFTIQKDEENKTSEIDELLYDIKDYTDVGMELMKKGKLTRNIAIRYIDTVYVYDIDRIEVNLKFQTVLDRALTAAEQMK